MSTNMIKEIIFNNEVSEELLWEYLSKDFKTTITNILNILYELLNNYDESKHQIEKILKILELLSKKENSIDNITVFHKEIKRLNSNIYKHLNNETITKIKNIIKRLQVISRHLKDSIINEESSKKILTIESIIYGTKNLKIISTIIKDNKDILKIKDHKDENILYKLLKKYSYLDETNEEEINYLYQVISLFINNEECNIEIIKNLNYYLKALKNIGRKHIKEIKRLLELKKQPITLNELERKYHISTKYPKSIERELNSFNMSHNGAIDLTKQPSYTIDGEDTECLDDALYLERNKDGTYTLYVHITYIPSLIPYLSKMNRESIKRVETYYLIDDAYPLYPKYVSNYLASLLPNNIRYTETGIWLIEPDMTIVEDSFKLVKSTIKSHHRLTYTNADEIIATKSKNDLCRSLTDLGIFALKQREKNKTKESYRQKENASSYNPHHESRLVDKSVSANIVQECALLFGKSKAEFYKKQGLPYIFRACGEQPKLDLKKQLIINMSEEEQLNLLTKLSYYTSIPTFHHGLGYETYTHAGSPARRSPDGQNQYIDEDIIFTKNLSDKTVYMWEERTKMLANHYNESTQRIEAFSNQYNYLTTKKLIRKP